MRVLVAHSSRHGSTAGIADRITVRLTERGLDAESCDVGDVSEVGSYDAYVVGSAAYMFHWMKEARSFVRRNRKVLASKPLWLFSSGPLGDEETDEDGRDLLEASRPKEFEEYESLTPKDMKVFFGAWDPTQPAVGVAEMFVKRMPETATAFPVGDFRDWDAIEAWADENAADLLGVSANDLLEAVRTEPFL